MCGIAGVVDRRGLDVRSALDLATTLTYRGPDAKAAFDGAGASVAQCRLAVVDVTSGDPPITDEAGAIGVALNGEIYNYRALRDELQASGHRLRTRGDTEVIAHLAESLEPAALARRLDGMFAFALWDDRRRRLVLGRDRFGEKPLHYWTDGTRFVFGSEIKAVLADPHVPRRLDPLALPAYLSFGYVPTPRTFFAGVHSLPPGHVLTVDARGRVDVETYWRPSVPGLDGCERLGIGYEDARREVRRLLCDAVDRRLVADVPLGALLSGGVDSSTVVALMARLSSRPVRTFTIGFDDRHGFDERPYAGEVARLYGTDHTAFVVDPDRVELIERLVHHYDQPFGDSSSLPTFVLAELTGEHVTVALSGDGGDEIFAGYERFAAASALTALDALPGPVLAMARRVAHHLPPGALAGRVGSVRRLLTPEARAGMPDTYRQWLSYVPDHWRRRLLSHRPDRAHDGYRALWDATEGAAPLDRLLVLNIRTYLLDDLLPKVDRMTMAHGLEVRTPYLDTALAELALRLPPAHKLRGWSCKRLLKSVARELLPPALLRRRKRGFGVPLDRWLRTDLRPYVDARLCSPRARVARHLDGDTVRALVAEHRRGADLGHAIWTLLTLEAWLRREGW